MLNTVHLHTTADTGWAPRSLSCVMWFKGTSLQSLRTPFVLVCVYCTQPQWSTQLTQLALGAWNLSGGIEPPLHSSVWGSGQPKINSRERSYGSPLPLPLSLSLSHSLNLVLSLFHSLIHNPNSAHDVSHTHTLPDFLDFSLFCCPAPWNINICLHSRVDRAEHWRNATSRTVRSTPKHFTLCMYIKAINRWIMTAYYTHRHRDRQGETGKPQSFVRLVIANEKCKQQFFNVFLLVLPIAYLVLSLSDIGYWTNSHKSRSYIYNTPIVFHLKLICLEDCSQLS